MPASHVALVQVMADSLPIWLPPHTPEDGPCTWAPTTQVEDPDGVSGSWLEPDPAQAGAAFEE